MSTWCREDSTISVEQICSLFFSLKSSFLLLVSCLFSFSLDNIYIGYVIFLWKGLDLINVNIILPPHCQNFLTSLSTMMHCQHGALLGDECAGHESWEEACVDYIRSCVPYTRKWSFHQALLPLPSDTQHMQMIWFLSLFFSNWEALQIHLDWQESRLANPMNLPQTKSNPGSDIYGQQRMACREITFMILIYEN